MKVVITGSKEYPFGSGNAAEDPSPTGGMELYVDRLVEALLSSGVELTVVTRRFSGQPERETRGRLTVVRVGFRKGFYLRNPTFNINTFRRLLGMDFDVLVAHGEIAQFFGLLAAKLRRKPVVMVCHGTATDQPQYPWVVRKVFGLIERLTYGLADATITHSPQHMRTKRFDIIYPGLDHRRTKRTTTTEQDTLRKELGIANEKVVLTTGRLLEVKGVEYLLQALKNVKEKCVCVVVGDGKERRRLEQLTHKENANVIFTGFRKDVNRFLSIADVFVLPSLSESLNYSMLEAAAMGVPVVVTDLGIIPKDAAFVVGKKDSAAIAEAINTVFAKPKLAAQKAERARRFSEQFNWDEAGKKYLAVLRRVA